jgi:hypothetical protein
VDFVRVLGPETSAILGGVTLDLSSPRLPANPVFADLADGESPAMERIWRAFVDRHRDDRWLLRRANALREFGATWLLPLYEASHRAPSLIRGEARVGRNEPCPCGSGKKYKRCCGAFLPQHLGHGGEVVEGVALLDGPGE